MPMTVDRRITTVAIAFAFCLHSYDLLFVVRGSGWFTRQERYLSESECDAEGRPLLIERHVLVAPGRDNVVVTRRFERVGDEDLSEQHQQPRQMSRTARQQVDSTGGGAAAASAPAAC